MHLWGQPWSQGWWGTAASVAPISCLAYGRKIELPSWFDIEQFVLRHPRDKWIAFSLDVAKAHKRIRVHPSELGFLCSAQWIQQGRTTGSFTERVTSAQPGRHTGGQERVQPM